MSFVIAVVLGLTLLFFLKELIIIGPIIAGFVSGVISKSAITGFFAGMFVALLGALIFRGSFVESFEFLKGAGITGFAFYETLEPIPFVKALFGIAGVAAATAAGFIGGLISR